MKQICLNPVFSSLRGNFNSSDEHGHKGTFRFRETAWGKKYFGLGESAKRNYTTNPLSVDEKARRNAFKAASEQRSTILKNASLRRVWQLKFQKEHTDGTTKCNTLNGYVQHAALNGLIDESGQPLE